MESQCDSESVSSEASLVKRRSYTKAFGEKKGSSDIGENYDKRRSRKGVKKRRLDSVCLSEGINIQHLKSLEENEPDEEICHSEKEISSEIDVSLSLDMNATDAEKTGRRSFPMVGPTTGLLDLNSKSFAPKGQPSNNPGSAHNSDKHSMLRDNDSTCVTSIDLNADDFSSSANLKLGDITECGSSMGVKEQKDAHLIWKEMKQNGFLSSSHGGIPMPKPRGRKSKNDLLKKKIEISKSEQVDRFTKIAAPSGLLTELNPSIINHVRNKNQVLAIMENIIRSEKHENNHGVGRKQHPAHKRSGSIEFSKSKDLVNMNNSIRGYQISEGRDEFNGKVFTSQSTSMSEEDVIATNLSSSRNLFDNSCPSSFEESENFSCMSSLSFKAATVASRWLDLLVQDIKGRLSALRRSKKRVRAVITTELPFLVSKEFSCDQEEDSYAVRCSSEGDSNGKASELHRAKWTALFDQMEMALSEEEKQLDSWLRQVKEMQLHCDQGLQKIHHHQAYFLQQVEPPENDSRELAVGAAAASIYSTCYYILSENGACS